jgi:tetratricopeptide (TPR) repeat protein
MEGGIGAHAGGWGKIVYVRAVRDGAALVDVLTANQLVGDDRSVSMEGPTRPNKIRGVLTADGRLLLCERPGEVSGGSQDLIALLGILPMGNVAAGEERALPFPLGGERVDLDLSRNAAILREIKAGEPGLAIFVLESAGKITTPLPPGYPVKEATEAASGEAAFDLAEGCLQSASVETISSIVPLGTTTVQRALKLRGVEDMSTDEMEEAGRVMLVREAVASACALAHKGEYEQAIGAIEPVVDSDLIEERAALRAAQIYAEAERWEDALAAAKKAMEANPEEPDAFDVAASAYRNLGRRDQSKQAFERAQELRRRMTGGR